MKYTCALPNGRKITSVYIDGTLTETIYGTDGKSTKLVLNDASDIMTHILFFAMQSLSDIMEGSIPPANREGMVGLMNFHDKIADEIVQTDDDNAASRSLADKSLGFARPVSKASGPITEFIFGDTTKGHQA